jgi:hypothetical protein
VYVVKYDSETELKETRAYQGCRATDNDDELSQAFIEQTKHVIKNRQFSVSSM